MDEKKDWQQIKDILAPAMELDAPSRSAYLASACGENANLRREVESLIQSSIESEDFIETPLFSPGDLIGSPSHMSGRRFGNFEIIREIGSGGMGAVYLARRTDGEFDQQVALKIVRQSIANIHTMERFRRERQILASLNHPNIAKLLDGGVTDMGEPYLVMEFVEGEAINDFVRRTRPSIKETLRLFVKVCRAVTYAHRNLVIHRDIKPGNILVNADGEPKLLDFGLAKLVDENLGAISRQDQTETAFRLLTPAYASPEQLRGEPLTTATDTYSLGVVLFELLTGARPFGFDGKTIDQIIFRISEQTPTAPSQVSKASSELKGDIDNVILCAIRSESARRYASVDEFAADIQRYLNGLPVSARPNTLRYRSGKYIRRHSIGVAAGTVIFLSLVGGLAATIWQSRRAEQQATRAEKRFNDVRKLANSYLYEISPQIENLQGSTKARETIIKRALEYLNSLAADDDNDHDLQLELAEAYEKIGNVQGSHNQPNLGSTKDSLDNFNKALEIRKRIALSDPTNLEYRRALVSSLCDVGFTLWWMDDTKGALENYRIALSDGEALLSEGSSAVREDLALLYFRRGMALAWNLHSDEAREDYDKALSFYTTLSAEQPANFTYSRRIGELYAYMGENFATAGNADASKIAFNKGIKTLESLTQKDANDAVVRRSLYHVYYLMTSSYLDLQIEPVMDVMAKMNVLAENAAKSDSENILALHDLAISYAATGRVYASIKKDPDALKYFLKSRDIFTRLVEIDPSSGEYRRSMALNYRRVAEVQRMDPGTSTANFLKAIEILERYSENDPDNRNLKTDIAETYRSLGLLYVSRSKLGSRTLNCQKARTWLQNGIDVYLNSFGEETLKEIERKTIKTLRDGLDQCR